MEPKPVKSSREPCYPTRREVLAGAASVALANLIGCDFILAETDTGGISVAPIFAHGEGRGATGCVVISPPVFLSEEEGMQILREELGKHEIHLKAGETWEGVRVPARIEKLEAKDKGDGTKDFEEKVVEEPDHAKPLKVDGIDADKKIAVEFVSQKEYRDLGGPMSASTVQSYDFKNVAEFVAEQVKKQGKERVFFGTFYDPLFEIPEDEPSQEGKKIDWKAVWKEQMERGKKESRELLRKQAQDFVGWLKEQKAIR